MVQYSFLVVEALISGCYSTCLGWFLRITVTVSHFWLLGYLYLNGTELILVITVLIAGCYGTCFCMLWYLFLVVAVDDFSITRFLLLQEAFLVVMVLFLVVMVPVSGCYSNFSGCYSNYFWVLYCV
jgi:hypothetical protein